MTLRRGTKRKAFTKSPYSGIKKFHSARLRKKYGGGSGGGPPRRPNKCPCGKDIWAGRRPKFDSDIYDFVLNRGKNTCVKCGAVLPRKRDRLGKSAYITVDHATDWKTHVYDQTDPHRFVDKGGNCWEAYYQEEVDDAYNDIYNLVTMCSSCNSKKSGPKFYDGGNPTKYLGKKKK